MKIATTLLLIVPVMLAMLACGCTTQAPTVTSPTTSPTITIPMAIPDLTGTWNGTTAGYLKSSGFDEGSPFRMNITSQKGQAFTGMKVYEWPDGKINIENVSGIIAPTGEIYFADDVKGINLARLTDPNTLEIIYLEDGPGDAKALVSHLTRQKS